VTAVADRSALEGTDATWNPVTGCTQVSAGCAHCYALRFAERWRGVPGHPYAQGFDLQLRPERLTQPLRWRRPRTIFVNSMSDLFHEAIPESYIQQVFAVMAQAVHHRFQVLTKRHHRLAALAMHTAGSLTAGCTNSKVRSRTQSTPQRDAGNRNGPGRAGKGIYRPYPVGPSCSVTLGRSSDTIKSELCGCSW